LRGGERRQWTLIVPQGRRAAHVGRAYSDSAPALRSAVASASPALQQRADMPQLHRWFTRACASGLMAALTGCAAAGSSADSAQALQQQLAQAIGAASCHDDSVCRVVAIGHKACGGPEGFLAWSTDTASAERIEALAAAQIEARRAEVARSGRVSDCRMQVPPQAQCSAAKRCELRQGLSPQNL